MQAIQYCVCMHGACSQKISYLLTSFDDALESIGTIYISTCSVKKIDSPGRNNGGGYVYVAVDMSHLRTSV